MKTVQPFRSLLEEFIKIRPAIYPGREMERQAVYQDVVTLLLASSRDLDTPPFDGMRERMEKVMELSYMSDAELAEGGMNRSDLNASFDAAIASYYAMRTRQLEPYMELLNR